MVGERGASVGIWYISHVTWYIVSTFRDQCLCKRVDLLSTCVLQGHTEFEPLWYSDAM